jgi:hypothetical protein
VSEYTYIDLRSDEGERQIGEARRGSDEGWRRTGGGRNSCGVARPVVLCHLYAREVRGGPSGNRIDRCPCFNAVCFHCYCRFWRIQNCQQLSRRDQWPYVVGRGGKQFVVPWRPEDVVGVTRRRWLTPAIMAANK